MWSADLCAVTRWRSGRQRSFSEERKGVQETDSLTRVEPRPPFRTLKIEADGDFWRGPVKPKSRLTGRWLERAGFRPGNRVDVACVVPGVIELRCHDAGTVVETTQPSSEQPGCPF